MKILSLDSESYGLNFLLLDMPDEKELISGEIHDIGLEACRLYYRTEETQPFELEVRNIKDYNEAFEWLLELITRKEFNVLKHRNEIDYITHRVVHGGGIYTEPTLLNDHVVDTISEFIEFAPYHNNYNLKAIRATMNSMPGTQQYAVFDTAFFHTLPPKAYTYGINYALTRKYNLRRFGFHGISHRYLTWKMAQMMNGGAEDFNLITMQLGHGCSASAIDHGKPVDTSMGFSPTEGLIMERRSGDVDPEMLIYLMHKEECTIHDLSEQLNKFGGLYGMSGGLPLEKIIKRAYKGDELSNIILDTFCYRIQKYIGSYMVALGGTVDGIAITGIDMKSFPRLRKRLFTPLEPFGIKLDSKKSEELLDYKEGIISSPDSKIKVAYIKQATKHALSHEVYEYITATGKD